ncbi:hypothetical protein ACFFX0_05975 [Citricoccus parietis]|uniref:Uncharacterized protein n=1 Tax=Citricoccus parietis TaxID=592307 RepID=A0ABV5FVV3_9MICC
MVQRVEDGVPHLFGEVTGIHVPAEDGQHAQAAQRGGTVEATGQQVAAGRLERKQRGGILHGASFRCLGSGGGASRPGQRLRPYWWYQRTVACSYSVARIVADPDQPPTPIATEGNHPRDQRFQPCPDRHRTQAVPEQQECRLGPGRRRLLHR